MEKKKTAKIILRILLSVTLVAFIAWIFSNSLRVATDSAAQSQSVTQVIQNFFKVIAPNSFIATATGEDFDLLEDIIRVLAHFAEFALLGALCFWTYRAYTFKKRWVFLPFSVAAFVGIVDEILQFFTPGRAFEWLDVGIDFGGVLIGCLFAWLTVWLGEKIHQKSVKKRLQKEGKNE
ncbi:MAG: VanZ family protein [Clostridia bacterium]|nr:VanZ family protein [Clostridia bacterium]